MKIFFIGDIVGSAGREMVKRFLPKVKAKYAIDIVIANNENMAGGFGITPQTFEEMCQAGVDIQTGGNHTYDKKEGIPVLEEEALCLRPANYPDGSPGRGHVIYTSPSGKKIGVLNIMGRVFMDPLDCPFQAADRILPELKAKTNVVFVDFHAEASSEKSAMGWHLDGRVSAVIGTHTHVQSGDERILPGGTAFLTDAGMTGPYDSVIGVRKDIIVERFITKRGRKFETATLDPWLCGVVIEIDESTGHATSIERVRIEENRPQTWIE